MRAAVLLGLRLATGTDGQRARSWATAAASALGVLVLLGVWGIAHSQVGTTTAFTPRQVGLLTFGTIGMIALPVLVLVSTVARLSARVRDRRLANLRLLGLSTAQTRVVAATEAGMSSLVGTLLGAAAFGGLVPALAQVEVGGRDWSTTSLLPPTAAWICVLVGVPAVSMLVASLPQRLAAGNAVEEVRHTPSPARALRVVPLAVGFVLCWSTRSSWVDQPNALGRWEVLAIMAGIGLLSVGMLLVIPAFVDLLATLLLRLGRGPLATLVGRRLQSQPAGVTRVVSALMIGLFVVVAARGVVGAFLSTPQYIHAADFVERAQAAEVTATADRTEATAATLRAIEGVRGVSTYPVLHGVPADQAASTDPDEIDMVTVLVATCAELADGTGTLPGCVEGRVSQVGEPWFFDTDVEAMAVREISGWEPRGPQATVDLAAVTTIDPDDFERVVGALSGTPTLVIPPETPGVAALLRETDRIAVAHAGPGRFLYDRVAAAGLRVDTMVDLENYDFVQGMRLLAALLAAVVLAIGLLTFTIAGIDRALNRRRELTALRLIGTPGGLLRTAQWCEAAFPTAFGSLLAIAAGGYAGATYLQLQEDIAVPLTTALALAAAAVVTSALLAWVTTLGTTAPLDPDHIRAE